MTRTFLLASSVFLSLSHTVTAVPYHLQTSFSGATFFDNFNFITSDPSGGWVSYVDQATAQGLGYATAGVNGAHLGVDHTSVLNPAGPGRRAVRIESKATFNKGLIIGDFAHMPTGCGTWPAFWMYGPNWPNSGEVDIIEGVNNQITNQISGHTGAGCQISGTNALASFNTNNCFDPATNTGCTFKARGMHTYGSGFNSVGGGVYAVQWTAGWISVWHWRHDNLPSNVKSNTPDPATWGHPMAIFAGGGCDVDNHFANMKIVVNTDFCGPWGGATFAAQGCGASCVDYVAGNPSAFSSAYWHINSIKIFQPSTPVAKVVVHNNMVGSGNATTDATSLIPLASITPIPLPNLAMGAPQAPAVGPPVNVHSRPKLVTSLPYGGLSSSTTTLTKWTGKTTSTVTMTVTSTAAAAART